MSAHAATTTHYCKQPGCTAEARSSVGRYSYCEAHQGAGRVNGAKRETSTLETQLDELRKAARRADRLRRRAEKLTREALVAKRDADHAETEYRQALAHAARYEQNGPGE